MSAKNVAVEQKTGTAATTRRKTHVPSSSHAEATNITKENITKKNSRLLFFLASLKGQKKSVSGCPCLRVASPLFFSQKKKLTLIKSAASGHRVAAHICRAVAP